MTNCHGLKMFAADGKMRMTDVADTEQLLRLMREIYWNLSLKLIMLISMLFV